MRRHAAAVLILALVPLSIGGEGSDPPPRPTGLVERTGISLMLLDVEVLDEEGNPVRGLTQADFEVRLNGKRWPLYSVDDFCDCPVDLAPGETGLVAADGAAAEVEPAPPATVVAEAPAGTSTGPEATRFVLYFDFSQLGPVGTDNARKEAKRWLRETMQEGDEVMVVAYSTPVGTRLLSRFSRDRTVLLGVVDDAFEDRTLFDPFPLGREMRIWQCCDCCLSECEVSCDQCGGCTACLGPCLYDGARREHSHGLRAFRALQRFLEQLSQEPGRKAMIFFHENGTMFPAKYFPVNADRVGDHVMELDRVAAEANLAHTAIYSAYTGYDDDYAVNLGANLADFTGGGYNRGPGDLGRMTDRARKDCECTYRLGLEPPTGRTGVFRARIAARGRNVPYRYRVTYLDEAERWLRGARAALDDPAAATDVSLAAAVVPVAATGKSWSIQVLVALDPSSLTLLPQKDGQQGTWEIGALLTTGKLRSSWEMLAVSSLRRETDQEDGAPPVVLHERTFEGVRPGSYDLRAFVRDGGINGYGGARAEIDLPVPGRRGLAGPFVLRSAARRVRTQLPLLDGEEMVADATRSKTIEEGRVPLGDGPIRAGRAVEFLSWVCTGKRSKKKDRSQVEPVQRYVSLDGEPLFRFEAAQLPDPGECGKLVDPLDTGPMAPGQYTYHVRWSSPDVDPLSADLEFEVVSDHNAGKFSSPAARIPTDAF